MGRGEGWRVEPERRGEAATHESTDLRRNILTRSATTVLHWYRYGTSTVVTPDARTSSAVFFFYRHASELQIADTPLSCKLQTRL